MSRERALLIRFGLLFDFIVLSHGLRQIVHVATTSNATAEWLAHQTTQPFPWDTARDDLIHDRDGAYGLVFRRRNRAMGHT
jgi:hypothetical protein